MPGPQKAATFFLDKEEIENGKRVAMRKVRVLCTDPDATESSSDEQDEELQRGSLQKRVVREMLIPALVPSQQAADHASSIQDCKFSYTEPVSSSSSLPLTPYRRNLNKTSSKRSPKKWRLRQMNPMSGRSKDPLTEIGRKAYIRVRQRRWGKCTTELCASSQGVPMWLGTFSSAKEAAIAHDEVARQLRGSEAITNFSSSSSSFSFHSPGVHSQPLGNHMNEYWPTFDMCADDKELLLSCADFEAMEHCLPSYSPSSVLDQPNFSDSGPLVSSPSSVLENIFTDDCASAPFQDSDVGVASGKVGEDCCSFRHASVRSGGKLKMSLATAGDQMEHNVQHDLAASEEPLFEVFGNLYDHEGSNFASEDGQACHEFVSLEDFSEDEGASLTSFELDAEALTWINLQP